MNASLRRNIVTGSALQVARRHHAGSVVLLYP